jgi:ribonuclease VapC
VGRGVIVLDASALIALLKLEPGWEVVDRHFGASIISSVNLAETLTKYAEYGGDIDEAIAAFAATKLEIVPATLSHAIDASRLRVPTKPFGLSLGDRFCFALARERNLAVLTAEQIWDKVKVGVTVVRIR